jgi:nucleotide-binding universal stress UspA family protein
MFIFAYDGSINGDWVSHYAIQLAAAHHDHRLTLVHVSAGPRQDAMLAEKLQRMQLECERHGVQFVVNLLPPVGSALFDAIRAAIPEGAEHYLICGIRAQDRRHDFLGGSTAAQLLHSGHCNVLVVRVVQPGLLGSPRRLLLPITLRPAGFRSGLAFLRLFGPQLSHLHLLSVTRVGRRRLRLLSHEHVERLRVPGQDYCERVEQEIAEQLGLGAKIMDAQVVVSDQISSEILLAANRTKSRLIYMGASERKPTERLFHGDLIEQVLRHATCDVAIYRGIA